MLGQDQDSVKSGSGQFEVRMRTVLGQDQDSVRSGSGQCQVRIRTV